MPRPPLSEKHPHGTLAPTLKFRMPAEELTAITREAKRRGVTISDYVRGLIATARAQEHRRST